MSTDISRGKPKSNWEFQGVLGLAKERIQPHKKNHIVLFGLDCQVVSEPPFVLFVAMGPTFDGRYLVLIFEIKGKGVARVITGWDMSDSEKRYYSKSKKG